MHVLGAGPWPAANRAGLAISSALARVRRLPAVVSRDHCNTLASAWAGVCRSRVSRDRVFSCSTMLSSCACATLLRSIKRGRYCWRSPSVFSLLPRCHGDRGAQKYTCTLVARVNALCSASSAPRSPVSERFSYSGSC